jgi:phosphate transport system substrate-binding protein
MNMRALTPLAASMAVLALLASACGGGGSGGEVITADGSSTVGPFTTKAAEDFRKENADVQITVGISGTGGGFERFCADETDISNASRAIDEEEQASCAAAGVEYVELQVATDALTNVVNLENDWTTCLTVDQLRSIWAPSSKLTNWKQIDSSFPDVPLELYGAGTDSGTFDYFTEAINGESGASRSDYSATEDDNVTVRGVSGQRGALGYLGLSYVEENAGRLKAVAIDGGDGCVEPSLETVQSGEYTPLSRPLYVYASRDSLEEKGQVDAFLAFLIGNQAVLARKARYVPLTAEQVQRTRTILEGAGIDAEAGGE